MTANQREALRLLGVYTAGRFDIWMLAGNAKAGCRAHIMSELLGVRTPQSKSGVNTLRDAFNALANAQGECIAQRESNFIGWAKAQNVYPEAA